MPSHHQRIDLKDLAARISELDKTPRYPAWVVIDGKAYPYGLGVERKDRLREVYLAHGGTAASWDRLVLAFLAPKAAPRAALEWAHADTFRHAVLYDVGDLYLVATASLYNTTESFRQSVLTGHYLERFGGNASFRSPALSDAGNRMATFLSFVVAEWFAAAKFKVPTEAGVVRAEIKKIATPGAKTLRIADPEGKDLGDLDVLAIDERAHVLRIVEIKYWKPGHSNETALAAASRLDDDLRRKIKARHKWVQENLAAVLAFMGAAAGNYTVRTTLASSRPMLVEDPDFDVTYLAALKQELASRA